jgi:autophagy-related protein 9
LFNKDLLDLRLPLPTPAQKVLTLTGLYQEPANGQEDMKWGTTLTRALEWNLRFCLMDYLFDRSGRVKDVFLKEKSRDVLIKGWALIILSHHVI